MHILTSRTFGQGVGTNTNNKQKTGSRVLARNDAPPKPLTSVLSFQAPGRKTRTIETKGVENQLMLKKSEVNVTCRHPHSLR
jgi:hypothetical protein